MNKRTRRVAGLLKEEISRIIMKDLHDPAVGIVTITEVKLSEDLKYAKVYASFMGGAAVRAKGLAGLERAVKFIRSELAGRISLRFVPELRFVYDESLDYATRIDTLLHQIHAEEKPQSQREDRTDGEGDEDASS